MKLGRLTKMCLNETYSNFRIGKNLSDALPIQDNLKKRRCFIAIIFNITLEYAIRKVQETNKDWN